MTAPVPALAASVLALALLAACSDGPPARSAAPAPSTAVGTPGTTAPQVSTAPSPGAPAEGPVTTTVDADGTTGFQSPSGNLICMVSRISAVCEIGEHSYTPPPKPDDCDLDHGTMVAVEGDEPARFLCHGDTARGVAYRVLPYGERISNGRFTCSSSEAGMACAGAAGEHGFELARARYRLY